MSVTELATWVEGDRVYLRIPSDDADLLSRVRDEVPGISWDATQAWWTAPVTRRVALGLRKLLTGTSQRLHINSQTAAALRTAAEQPATPDITLTEDEQQIVASFEFHGRYQALMEDLDATLRGGKWYLPLSSAGDLVDKIEHRNIDLVVDDAVQRLATAPPVPLDGYSGTLISLKNVPTESLDYVQTTVKRDKKKKSMAARLADNRIESVYDLLNRFPLRYIDRTKPSTIRMLKDGELATVLGTITSVPPYDYTRNLSKLVIRDNDGTLFSVAFFKQKWATKKFRVGDEVIVHGKYEPYRPKKGGVYPQFSNAQVDKVGDTKGALPVVPVYPQSEKSGITTWDIVQSMNEALNRLNPPLSDPLPEKLVTSHDLMTRDAAYRAVHFPVSPSQVETAKQRLVYEELLGLQLYIQQQKQSYKRLTAVPHHLDATGVRTAYLESLSYNPTGAQQRAMDAIIGDLTQGGWNPSPMHRLLQGDVGSGKSTVALFTLLATVDAGHQGALMAPTEILAEQLFTELRTAVERSSLISPRTGELLNVRFLGSKTRIAEKRSVLAGLKDGSIDIAVGTHALISEGVEFADLGAVVIDEQHRFGAAQRTKLRQARSDGKTPHLLVMTATPIPRTGAMVMYGDLDLTILDEMPPGRVPIATTWTEVDAKDIVTDPFSPVWDDVLSEVAKGHQAYVIASLVEDSEKIAAQSAEDAYLALSNGPLSSVRVGMVHGRQPRQEREEIMAAFAAGDLDVLVSTTVIEVGVNVPNATVMVVLDAGRFGIAQLHQIRGRVGRSNIPSRCYLVGTTRTSEGRERLQALVESTDGFYLAEKDLEIRGEGTLFGDRQSGDSDLRIARLREHLDILEVAKKDAEQLLQSDPTGQSYGELVHEVEEMYKEEEIQS